MRPQRITPLALALVLLASSLIGVVAPLASAGPTPATVHPAATVFVQATNSRGFAETNFYTGYSEGVVYFTVTDPSDTSAAIQINDLNASRDGLSNPVFTYTANTTLGTNSSSANGVGYLIPTTLVYGGWWNVTARGTLGGFNSFRFFVDTYYTSVSLTQPQALPGSAVTAIYQVDQSPNGAPYTHATVSIIGNYYTNTAIYVPLFKPALSEGVSSLGSFNFTLPTNASVDGYFELIVYANATAPANVSETGYAYGASSNLSAPGLNLEPCAWGCGTTSAFSNGQTAFLNVQDLIVGHYGSTAAAGMTASLSFLADGQAVTVPGAPTTLTLNASGAAEIAFDASSSVFSTTHTNEITVAVTDPTDPGLSTTCANGCFVTHTFFTVSPLGQIAPELTVSLNAIQYYGGDTVTASWALGGQNGSAPSGWSVGHWDAYEEGVADTILAWGFLNSTAVTGSFSFGVPVNFGGSIEVYVEAFNATDNFGASMTAIVTAPTILLNPSEEYFLPGDSITVQVTTEGSVFSSTTLYDTVEASSGFRLVSGVLSGNQITFTVPTVAPPSYFDISVAAQSPTLGIVAAAETEITEGSGYQLEVGVQTKSNYADGSYQPGQTIQLSYNLISVGPNTVPPRNLYVWIYPGQTEYVGSSYGAIQMETTSTSGTISYTIPGNTPAGDQPFTVYVESVTCGEYICPEAENTFGVFVEPNPSVLSEDVGGAGSGLTVGWLVLLVIVIVVAVILLLVIRRRGGGRSSPPPSPVQPYSPSSTSSGSGATSGGATPSWQESGGSGSPSGGSTAPDSSPPPMPKAPSS